MRVLLTRPEADAARTGQALVAAGHQAVVAPLMDVRALDADLPDHPPQAVLATSANAIRAMTGRLSASDLKTRPLLTVGDATAAAAAEAGWRDIRSADGDAAALAALVRVSLAPEAGPLLHLSGRHIAADLADLLAPAGFSVIRAVVYETVAAERLPEAARASLAERAVDGALVYSPRSARVLVDLASRAGLFAALSEVSQFCLSEATAAPLRAAGIMRIAVAAHPTESALLRLLDRAR